MTTTTNFARRYSLREAMNVVMCSNMVSYGIDVGSTTVRAKAARIIAKPNGEKEISPIGDSLCFLTPFKGDILIEGEILRQICAWAEKLPHPDIGSILFTGEARLTENWRNLATGLTERFDNFLSAEIDPDTETELAAKGAKACELSRNHPAKSVIHIDIGGGTSNFARVENGTIVDKSCLNIGCRKWVFGDRKIINKRKEALNIEATLGIHGFAAWQDDTVKQITDYLANIIANHAMGRAMPSEFIVTPWKHTNAGQASTNTILSLSGGITDAWSETDPLRFSDIGVALARSLKRLFHERQICVYLPDGASHATVYGVTVHGFQLSGASVWCACKAHPTVLRRIPLVNVGTTQLPDDAFAVYLSSINTENIRDIAHVWSQQLARAMGHGPAIFLMAPNLAKTFGFIVDRALGKEQVRNLIVLDEIVLPKTNMPHDSDPGVATIDIRLFNNQNRHAVVMRELRHCNEIKYIHLGALTNKKRLHDYRHRISP